MAGVIETAVRELGLRELLGCEAHISPLIEFGKNMTNSWDSGF